MLKRTEFGLRDTEDARWMTSDGIIAMHSLHGRLIIILYGNGSFYSCSSRVLNCTEADGTEILCVAAVAASVLDPMAERCVQHFPEA